MKHPLLFPQDQSGRKRRNSGRGGITLSRVLYNACTRVCSFSLPFPSRPVPRPPPSHLLPRHYPDEKTRKPIRTPGNKCMPTLPSWPQRVSKSKNKKTRKGRKKQIAMIFLGFRYSGIGISKSVAGNDVGSKTYICYYAGTSVFLFALLSFFSTREKK